MLRPPRDRRGRASGPRRGGRLDRDGPRGGFPNRYWSHPLVGDRRR